MHHSCAWPRLFATPAAMMIASALALFLTSGAVAQPAEREEGARDQPNIVFILSDDESVALHGSMQRVRQLIEERGTVFDNFFAPYPLCCPARATILRGQYPHNTLIEGNRPPQGGFGTFRALGREDSTIATWLQEAGYRTAFYGKYMNGYTETDAPPPGWDEWHAANNNGYFNVNYALNENGTVQHYGDAPEDYLTDVIARKAAEHIRRFSAEGRPFFLFLSPTSPHSPYNPAPRHKGMFADASLPRPPSFNEEDVSDKPPFLAELPRIRDDQIDDMQTEHRRRLECLQAVDEMVETVVDALAETGALENTYIVYSSDNGFHMGEHRLLSGKDTAYEEDIRVPFAVRGPDVPEGRHIGAMAIQTDIAATFADWAGIESPDFVDGRSLAPLFADGQGAGATRPWRNAFLIQRHGLVSDRRLTPAGAFAIRTRNHVYIAYENGKREMYDLAEDPNQMHNISASADPEVIQALVNRMIELRGCAGSSCREIENRPLAD